MKGFCIMASDKCNIIKPSKMLAADDIPDRIFSVVYDIYHNNILLKVKSDYLFEDSWTEE